MNQFIPARDAVEPFVLRPFCRRNGAVSLSLLKVSDVTSITVISRTALRKYRNWSFYFIKQRKDLISAKLETRLITVFRSSTARLT
jgi:hypothetical protein